MRRLSHVMGFMVDPRHGDDIWTSDDKSFLKTPAVGPHISTKQLELNSNLLSGFIPIPAS